MSSDAVLVEAVYGLGEGLVSGLLEADRYTVSVCLVVTPISCDCTHRSCDSAHSCRIVVDGNIAKLSATYKESRSEDRASACTLKCREHSNTQGSSYVLAEAVSPAQW